MDAIERAYLEGLVERVLEAVYEVSGALGSGFLGSIYEKAMIRELQIRGMRVTSRVSVPVVYKGERIGQCSTDLVVEGLLQVKLRTGTWFRQEHMVQCLNFLRVSGLHEALLISFQNPQVKWRCLTLDM